MSMTESTPSFALLLRRHRQAAELTQEALAERAGISWRAISDLERGIRQSPRKDTVALLTDALGLTGAERGAFALAARQALVPIQTSRTGSEAQRPGEEQPHAAPLPMGGYLGAVPEYPLVAREVEWASIARALEAVRLSQGRCILLAGESGVGKTRLAQEAMVQASGMGFLVLVGRCYEQDTSVPFAPFLELLATAAERASSALRAAIPRHFTDLGLVLPALATVAPLPTGEDPRRRIVAAAGRFLAGLASETPLAVLLDDLHWADSASMDLLAHLAHALRGGRVLLLGTYRDVEIGRHHPLEALLSSLVRDRVVEVLALQRLDLAGTAALIRARFDGDEVSGVLRDAVHQRAEGNPFFTEEVLTALLHQGVIAHDAGRWGLRASPPLVVPESVRSVVGQRVGRLGKQVQESLTLASVLGQEFDPELLIEAAHVDEEITLAQLDNALDAHVLEVRRAGREDRYVFAHSLIAQVLYDEIPRHRLRRLHRQAGEALERVRGERPEVAGEMARHFLAAGDTARAARYARRAGDHAASLYAHAEAVRHYETAVDLLEEQDDVLGVALARRKLGSACRYLHQMERALAAYQAALTTYERLGDGAGQAAVEWEIGGVYRDTVDYRAAASHQARALSLWPEDHDLPGLAGLLLDASGTKTSAGENEEAASLAARALALAEGQADPALQAHALATYAVSRHLHGASGEARVLLDRAEPLAQRANALHVLWRIYHYRGWVHEALGAPLKAVDEWRKATAVGELAGTPGRVALICAVAARVYLELGEWAEARSAAQRAAMLGFQAPEVEAINVWVSGDHAGGLARMKHALEAARQRHDLHLMVGFNDLLANWYLDLGHVADAEAPARTAVTLLREHAHWGMTAWACGAVAEAVVRCGSLDADTVLQECEMLVARYDHIAATPQLLRARGLLRQREGNLIAAQAALRESAAVARAQGANVSLARTLLALAEAARSAGDEAAAHEADAERGGIVAQIGPEARGLAWAQEYGSYNPQ